MPNALAAFLSTAVSTLTLVPVLLGGCATTGADRTAQPSARSAATLDGTAWQTPCTKRSVTQIRYEAGRFSGSYRRYADDACATAIAENRWDGSAEVTGQLDGGQLALDLQFESFDAQMLTEDSAAAANRDRYCDLDGWQAGQTRDVYGQPCAGWAVQRGARSFERVLVDGDSLYFGAGTPVSPDSTAADRPATIDRARVFGRVEVAR